MKQIDSVIEGEICPGDTLKHNDVYFDFIKYDSIHKNLNIKQNCSLSLHSSIELQLLL